MAKEDKELGTPGGIAPDWNSFTRRDNTYQIDPLDTNPDLRFPYNIPVYDEMRNTDGQIGSLLNACSLPIMSAKWRLVGDGVRPEVLAFVKSELGLIEPGETLSRNRRQGVVWLEHLEQALLFMPFGFMPFEQVYQPGPPLPGQEGLDMGTVLHLRKLAPRLPRTISKISVGSDGGLAGVHQRRLIFKGLDPDVFIPVDRLVMYCLRREGADWSGRSLLRTAYRHWLINDKLMRLAPQIIERNGMGLPVVGYDPAIVAKEDALEVGVDARAGATAAIALPIGMTFKLQGVEGSTADPMALLKYNDEKIAASSLAMVLTLGHDAGARSLGDTFQDLFIRSLQTIANSVATTATEHIVRDLVELNFGPDEPYPTITPGDMTQNTEITTAALKELVDAGIVVADDDLEAHMRKREGLPEADKATSRAKAPAPATAPLALSAEVQAANDALDASRQAELKAIHARMLSLSVGAHVPGV